MFTGIAGAIAWGVSTFLIGIALSMSPFVNSTSAIFLSPFISTFLHDFMSTIYVLVYNLIFRKAKDFKASLFSKAGLLAVFAGLFAGPVGMTGYVLTVSYMGSSIAAIASSIFPAVGAILARIFLKEKMKWYQYVSLVICLLGIYGLSYSSDINITNFWLGLLGAVLCSFGWGIEGVLIASAMKKKTISDETLLQIREGTSAIFYAVVLLPILQAWPLTIQVFNFNTNNFAFLVIASAAVFGMSSYLFYYKSISQIGPSKAMILNITYVIWTILLNLVVYHALLSWISIVCLFVVMTFSILTAVDVKTLFKKKQ